MGPQLYRCGNMAEVRHIADAAARLQWGRNFIVAEMLCRSVSILPRYPLQWGRNFIVAEMPAGTGARPKRHQLQWGRNFIVAEIFSSQVDRLPVGTLQWGRNFIVAEISKSVSVQDATGRASMGPQLYRCGNVLLYGYWRLDPLASMGPQLYRCGNDLKIKTSEIQEVQLQWGRNFIVAEIRS